ncbi:MAG: 50S ribosomal protein L18 [Bacteroidetes bacterium]|nr:MAG: 50S ribosomal protein L18 [Bacteroidota bacterium]
MATNSKTNRRLKIKYRVRKRVFGSDEKPRLSVFRSNKQIYAQLISDNKGATLVSASSREKVFADKKVPKSEMAKEVGKLLAEKAREAGIETIVFDRNGYLYHGRVKSLAEGAREGGLKF